MGCRPQAKVKIKKTNSEVPLKKETEMNGADRTFSLKSDNMAQDVKNMEQIINQLRASKRNESADDLEALNAQSYQCRETFEQIGKATPKRTENYTWNAYSECGLNLYRFLLTIISQ